MFPQTLFGEHVAITPFIPLVANVRISSVMSNA